MSESTVLEFTGERFTPECVREIWYEHMHRYAFAAPHAQGREVLDAACGEGYGAALLAQNGASAVLGIDVSASAIAHAQRRYGSLPGLRFAEADVTRLDHLPAASFDLIVSFETLEHLHAQERMVAGFRRLLRPDGLLILSSPDKKTYSEASGFHNEFHVRELYREELETLLAREFPAVRLLGQKLLFQSLIYDLEQPPRAGQAQVLDQDGRISQGPDYPPVYFIALCALTAERLAAIAPGLHLFGDRAESVYAHYYHEIRKNMQAGGVIADLVAQLEAARAEIARLSAPTIAP